MEEEYHRGTTDPLTRTVAGSRSVGGRLKVMIAEGRGKGVLPTPQIEDYRFGHIVIDGREHTRDVIVLPDRVVSNWWRKDGHSLVVEDLEDVLVDLPGRLVIGTGAYGRMHPDPKAIEDLRGRGIEIEVLQTDDAVRRYSSLDAAATAAALHLTC